MIMYQGKTNQFGRIEYSGTLRHRNPKICAVGAIALYFFDRFHVHQEKLPDIESAANWFDVKCFTN